MMPSVACLCPTYGRVSLLEEAVESFIRQDYAGRSRLIIVNDLAEQTLFVDHPNVTVHNLTERCPTLGSKRNLTATFSDEEFMLTWGDDDIHLQGRITRMVDAVGGGDFIMEGRHYCLNGRLYKNSHTTAGAHIIRRKFFESCGGFDASLNRGEDVAFNARVFAAIGTTPVCREEPQFIYRWSTGRPHTSWSNDRYTLIADDVAKRLAKGEEPTGDYVLQPKWKLDYKEMTKTAVEK